jgi:hypothetical protein
MSHTDTDSVKSTSARIMFEGVRSIRSQNRVRSRPDAFVPNVEGAWVYPQLHTRRPRPFPAKRPMSSISIMLLLGTLFISLPLPGFALGIPDTDFPGQDLLSFDQKSNSPQECEEACAANNRCRSWTYGKPGTNGTNPLKSHCWLKSGVPNGVQNSCCTSGVVRGNL